MKHQYVVHEWRPDELEKNLATMGDSAWNLVSLVWFPPKRVPHQIYPVDVNSRTSVLPTPESNIVLEVEDHATARWHAVFERPLVERIPKPGIGSYCGRSSHDPTGDTFYPDHGRCRGTGFTDPLTLDPYTCGCSCHGAESLSYVMRECVRGMAHNDDPHAAARIHRFCPGREDRADGRGEATCSCECHVAKALEAIADKKEARR